MKKKKQMKRDAMLHAVTSGQGIKDKTPPPIMLAKSERMAITLITERKQQLVDDENEVVAEIIAKYGLDPAKAGTDYKITANAIIFAPPVEAEQPPAVDKPANVATDTEADSKTEAAEAIEPPPADKFNVMDDDAVKESARLLSSPPN